MYCLKNKVRVKSSHFLSVERGAETVSGLAVTLEISVLRSGGEGWPTQRCQGLRPEGENKHRPHHGVRTSSSALLT